MKKPKFKVGDRCRVIKNLFAPDCVGFEVSITDISVSRNGKYFYTTLFEKGIKGICSENCLELIE